MNTAFMSQKCLGNFEMIKIIILCLLIELIINEEHLLWWSPNKNLNFIAPHYLSESKKENRRLAVVIESKNHDNILLC